MKDQELPFLMSKEQGFSQREVPATTSLQEENAARPLACEGAG
jgi:hypothetical protein